MLAVSDHMVLAGIWAAIVAAALALLALLSSIPRWLARQFPLSRASYLIPQERYKAKSFPGGPRKELYPRWLTVGIGEYILPLRIVPRTEIEVDEVHLDFWGSDANHVEVLQSENPFIVSVGPPRDDGRVHLRDWHGILHNASGPGPVVYKAHEVWVQGFRIRTSGGFDGIARLRVLMRGRRAVEIKLRFRVDPTDTRDDLAFLKNLPAQLTHAELERRKGVMRTITKRRAALGFQSPQLAGKEPLPKAWVEEQLEMMNESWRQEEYYIELG